MESCNNLQTQTREENNIQAFKGDGEKNILGSIQKNVEPCKWILKVGLNVN